MNPLYGMNAYVRDGRKYISASAANQYMQCPQMFWLSRFWESKHINMAFITGHFVHDCIQCFHKDGDPNIRENAQFHMNQTHNKLQKRLEENPYTKVEQTLGEVRDMLDRAQQYVRNYIEHYRGRRYRVVDVERYFEVPLMLNDEETEYWFHGYMDMVVETEQGYDVIEIKTTSDRDLSKYTRKHERINQTYGYSYAAGKVLDKPANIVYDIIKKATPSDPKLLKCTRAEHNDLCCNGTGVKGLSKAKGQNVSKLAMERALDEYTHLDPTDYRSFMADLPDGYHGLFRRETVILPHDDLQAWSANMVMVAKSIYAEEPVVYKCYESCMGQFGMCDYNCFCEHNNIKELKTKLKLKEGKDDSWNKFIG